MPREIERKMMMRASNSYEKERNVRDEERIEKIEGRRKEETIRDVDNSFDDIAPRQIEKF